MHKCIIATVTVHIYIVIVARVFNILALFLVMLGLRERGVVSEEIIKNYKRNILLNRCVE